MKRMPSPTIDFAQNLYNAYRKRYLEQHEVDADEWERLVKMDMDQLGKEGHSVADMSFILTAKAARELIEN